MNKKNSIAGMSDILAEYVTSLKKRRRYRVYETLLLMTLDDNLLQMLEEVIILAQKKFLINEIYIDKNILNKITKQVNIICKSKYFKEQFSTQEIETRKEIMIKIAQELSAYCFVNLRLKEQVERLPERIKERLGPGLKASADLQSTEVDLPLIDHKTTLKNNVKNYVLKFNEGTNLNEIIQYLKENLNIRNHPKKNKMSLATGHNLLYLEQAIKDKTSRNDDEKFEYTEQLIGRKLFSEYGQKISTENVSKILQRIHKIKKEINTD